MKYNFLSCRDLWIKQNVQVFCNAAMGFQLGTPYSHKNRYRKTLLWDFSYLWQLEIIISRPSEVLSRVDWQIYFKVAQNLVLNFMYVS